MIKLPRFISGSSAKEVWEFDAVVIGSGIAGIIATLKLSKHMKVALITKERLVDSNSFYAQGGLAAPVSEEDTDELWQKDTIRAGDGLCNEAAVKKIITETPRILEEIRQMGVPFDMDQNGLYQLGREAFHSVRRIIHAGGDQTGKLISSTMVSQLKTSSTAVIFEESFVIDILNDDEGNVAGVSAIIEDNDVIFSSPNVLICTGGCGQLFFFTSNPQVATGDGMAMALRAGATLCDMEFIQFHPTVCFAIPGQSFLVSEAVRGEGARLVNDRGERFMPNYHESAELAPRDVVSRACFEEMKKGNGEWIFLDTTQFDQSFFAKRFPTIYAQCLKAGFDPTKQPIPVSPGAHYMMGGIETDLSCRTSLKGLYACGESGSNGMHGANRLASNSIPEALVTGSIAADAVLDDSNNSKKPEYPTKPESGKLPLSRSEIRLENWESIGLVRNDQIMSAHLSKIRQGTMLVQSALSLGAMELANMYALTSAITLCALRREESRGCHMRTDHPTHNPNWATQRTNTLWRQDGDYVFIDSSTHRKDKNTWDQ